MFSESAEMFSDPEEYEKWKARGWRARDAQMGWERCQPAGQMVIQWDLPLIVA
jgi:hypothetical protein